MVLYAHNPTVARYPGWEEEVFINDCTPIFAPSLIKKNDMQFYMPCDKDLDRYEQIKNFLLDDKVVYTWHHKPGSGFDFLKMSQNKGTKGIRDKVFYRHFDLRPQVTYQRIIKEEHLEAAWKGREKTQIGKL